MPPLKNERVIGGQGWLDWAKRYLLVAELELLLLLLLSITVPDVSF
jgi:hypothetical protein